MGKSTKTNVIVNEGATEVMTKSFLTSEMLPCATNIAKWTETVARQQVDLVTPCFRAMHNVTMLLSPVIAEIEEKQGFKLLGYKNMDELATAEWGISHGTLVNARKIFGRFGEKDNDGRNVITDKWTDFGARKLLLLTSASQSVINNVSPDMTVDEIKALMNPTTVVVEPQNSEDEENTTTSTESGENTTSTESGENTTTSTESGENTTTNVNVDNKTKIEYSDFEIATLSTIRQLKDNGYKIVALAPQDSDLTNYNLIIK